MTPKPLPRNWAIPTAILEADIAVNNGRLRCKLLVFRTCRDLDRAWRTFSTPLGRRCRGAVSQLRVWKTRMNADGTEEKRIQVDPRYFCVMGLVVKHLTMEVIAHESVHAGYAWLKRRSRSWWDAQAREMDEEAVCYPAGRIAAGVNRVIQAAGLYPQQSSKKGK